MLLGCVHPCESLEKSQECSFMGKRPPLPRRVVEARQGWWHFANSTREQWRLKPMCRGLGEPRHERITLMRPRKLFYYTRTSADTHVKPHTAGPLSSGTHSTGDYSVLSILISACSPFSGRFTPPAHYSRSFALCQLT